VTHQVPKIGESRKLYPRVTVSRGRVDLSSTMGDGELTDALLHGSRIRVNKLLRFAVSFRYGAGIETEK
jgi:hypothetical protein